MDIIKKILSAKVFLAVQIIITCVFLYTLLNFAVLPDKYLYPIIIAIIALVIITFLLQLKAEDTSIRAILSRIVAVIVSCGLIFGNVEINRGSGFISGFSGIDYQTNAISVIVLKDSDYTELKDLENKTLGIVQDEDAKNLTDALTDIRGHINAEYKSYADFERLGDNLYNNNVDAIIINEAYRGMIEENHPDLETETRVIYQVAIKEKTENIANNGAIKDGVFNICITGIDTYGPVSTRSRSDVNMVMTVNMNTHKILMTGIPRDYYVTLASKGAKDKLTHSGIYGVNETVNTIANFLDIDIDYYYRINFTSLVNVVDVLGGIDVYSDKTFVPHTNNAITIKEGDNHMDGAMALAFARERYAYASGDRHRIQNQQDVMMAIIRKLLTPEVLSNYKEILEKVDGSFETNMSSEDIISVIKMQLNDLKGYEMINQYLDGNGKRMTGGYSMPRSNLYYMIPNEKTVTEAKKKIDVIEKEKVVADTE